MKQSANAMETVKPSRFGQDLLVALEHGGGKPSDGASLYDIKLFGNKILKKLREDLAFAQSNYIKRMNADVMEFELGHGSNEDAVRGMDQNQMHKELKRLHREILSLRLSETFLRKLCHQVLAINDCLPLCSLQQNLAGIVSKIHANELKSNKYSAQTKQQLFQKVSRVLQELLQSIARDVKGSMGFMPGAIEKRANAGGTHSDQTQLQALRELSEPIKSMLCSTIAFIDKENAICASIAS